MSCPLRFVGKDFDPDKFEEQTGLTPVSISRKDERPTYNGKPYGRIMPYSIVSLTASDADFDDFKLQVEEVINYLKNNYKQLQLAKGIAGLEYATLDFGVKFYCDKFTKRFWLPPELIVLAGELNISIELSIYNDDFFEKEDAGDSEPG
ncbi:MAG: hypothetical protein EOP56_16315 [Sphingobacteriales bacterium]|nr:MAG: hypothetical protein EOP56_16315 [Sphingobacteriales bacterium]